MGEFARVFRERREEALACYRLLTQLASIPAPAIGGFLAQLDPRAPLLFRCVAMSATALALPLVLKVSSRRR